MNREAEVMAAKLQGKSTDYRVVKLRGMEIWAIEEWVEYRWPFRLFWGPGRWVTIKKNDSWTRPQEFSTSGAARDRIEELEERDIYERAKKEKQWDPV